MSKPSNPIGRNFTLPGAGRIDSTPLCNASAPPPPAPRRGRPRHLARRGGDDLGLPPSGQAPLSMGPCPGERLIGGSLRGGRSRARIWTHWAIALVLRRYYASVALVTALVLHWRRVGIVVALCWYSTGTEVWYRTSPDLVLLWHYTGTTVLQQRSYLGTLLVLHMDCSGASQVLYWCCIGIVLVL